MSNSKLVDIEPGGESTQQVPSCRISCLLLLTQQIRIYPNSYRDSSKADRTNAWYVRPSFKMSLEYNREANAEHTKSEMKTHDFGGEGTATTNEDEESAQKLGNAGKTANSVGVRDQGMYCC